MSGEKYIESLIEYIEEGQKRIDSAKEKLVNSTDDFDIWLKYSNKKNDYSYIFGMKSPIMKLLKNYCPEVLERRYSILDIEWLMEIVDQLDSEGFITKEEIKELKVYLHKINFGSMRINW